MSFFTYRQNNSGGSFVENEHVNIFVIIEADSAKQADNKAKSIDIYFDGCENGTDCHCCGDRWSRAATTYFEEKGFSEKYGGDRGTIIYYKNGNKEIIGERMETQAI